MAIGGLHTSFGPPRSDFFTQPIDKAELSNWLVQREKSRCSTRAGASLSRDRVEGAGLHWKRRDHATNATDYPRECVREEDQEGSNPTGGVFLPATTREGLGLPGIEDAQ
jgi:hypothetical protein